MIVTIGSINLDLIARVDRLPGPGETVPGRSFTTAPGGKGANQALAARRAGAAVRMIAAVGNDPFADQALVMLRQGGVDLSGVTRVDAPTGTALILVDDGGENMIAVVPGANGTICPAALEGAAMGPGDFLLVQNEIPLDTVEAALGSARKGGAVSVYNPAPFVRQAAHLLAGADHLVVNETEFDLYARELALGSGDRRARMQAFVDATGRTLIVTLGVKGVVAAAPSGWLECPAMKIEPVDTVGAGDTFCGYLAAGLAQGSRLDEALRRSVVAAALACLKPGAQPSIPPCGEVEKAMEPG